MRPSSKMAGPPTSAEEFPASPASPPKAVAFRSAKQRFSNFPRLLRICTGKRNIDHADRKAHWKRCPGCPGPRHCEEPEGTCGGYCLPEADALTPIVHLTLLH